MKCKFKSLLLVLAAMLCSTPLFAHDFEVDGIYYNITSDEDMTVEVTYRGNSSNSYSNEYSGTVTIPESVTYNEKSYSVTSIGNSAFYDCYNLTSITIPNSVESIGGSVFSYCSGLTSITIPNSVTSIGNSAFYNCSGLTSITIPNSVESIGKYAFSGCSGLTSIIIPNSVTSIGNSAFYDCSGLTSITIPNSVTSIGNSAFYDCSKLTSVSIGDRVSSIGNYAFYKCNNLTSIKIGNSVTSIGAQAFDGCSGLSSIKLPNSVTSIGNYAFQNCSGLRSITMGSSVTSIGNYAFQNCSGLRSITMGSSVTSIGDYAFFGCSKLKSITLPNSVTSIGKYVLSGCSALTSISIGSGLSSIGEDVFDGCSKLTSIIVDPENTKYDSRDNCNAIIETQTNTLFAGCKNSTIPNSVKTIGYEAFNNCTGLTSIIIPNGVTGIDWYAFYGCSGLTSITIPSSMEWIGDYAFKGCSGLTEVISYIPEDMLFSAGSSTFYGVPANCVLKVPFGAKETYADTRGWSRFSNIVEVESVSGVTDLVLKEGENFENIIPFEAKSVTYSRTLPNLMWNALYLPIEIPMEELSENYDVAYFNNMHAYDRDNNGEIDDMKMEVFLIKEGTLHANYPYLIRAKNEAAKQLNLELNDVEVKSTAKEYCTSIPVASAYMDIELAGVYERHEGTELEDCYAITAKGSWSPIATNSYLNPYRLYLKMTTRPGSPVKVSPQALQSIRISVQGEEGTTGIEVPTVNGQNSTEIYDLQGRRVTNPKKGMYIVNGKKVMF